MDIAALAIFAPVKKVLDIFRYLFIGEEVQWREAGTIIGSWVAGIGLVALVGASSFADQFGFDGLNLADIILAGIEVGSLAGVTADLAQPDGVTIR